MTTGLYIIRGQPPHKGHLHVIKEMMQKECDEIIVGVGSAEEGYTKRNPLTGGERVHIFNKLLAAELDKPYSVVPIVDLNNPPKYAAYVERIVPPFDVVYANNDTTPLFEARGYQTRTWERVHDGLSASSIRERIALGDNSWIDDVHPLVYQELVDRDAPSRIWQIMNDQSEKAESVFHRNAVINTVDVIVRYQEGIVFIERAKDPFKGMLALPGGHVDLSDWESDDIEEVLERAARRETFEETGLTLSNLQQLKSYSAHDRDPRGRYITQVFTADGHGEPKAGDDAKNVHVVSLDSLPALAFDHSLIMEDYIRYGK